LATAPAPAPAPDAAAASAEDGGLDGMTVSAEGTLLAPGVAELYASGDPRLKTIADAMQRRFEDRAKSQRFTGDFRNVELARQEIARLRKLPQTPEITAQIAGLDRMIGGAEKGRGTTVTAIATNSPAGKSLAAEVGQRANASLVKAEGAAGIMESANMVREALNTGNVIAGPLAGPRMKFAQVLELAGAGDKEKLVNTRTAIQGLATLTLESRAELKGQGQVTENEQKLLERARSGNIEDMTVAELQQVVNVSQRLSNRLWSNHQTMLKTMESDPAAKDVIRYYYPTSTLPPAVGQSSPKGEANKRTQGLDKIFGGEK
jgi:hypothetical protein